MVPKLNTKEVNLKGKSFFVHAMQALREEDV
jgi:hypothetical protein